MQNILLLIVALLPLSCKKDRPVISVDVYQLKSFTVNQSNSITSITNAVLEDHPFIKNEDIEFYDAASCTLTLKGTINPTIKTWGPDKAFAVTVNNEIVYCGKIHPSYLSSLTVGVPFIDPILSGNSVSLGFIYLSNIPNLKQLDFRNDTRILNAFKSSKRLK